MPIRTFICIFFFTCLLSAEMSIFSGGSGQLKNPYNAIVKDISKSIFKVMSTKVDQLRSNYIWRVNNKELSFYSNKGEGCHNKVTNSQGLKLISSINQLGSFQPDQISQELKFSSCYYPFTLELSTKGENLVKPKEDVLSQVIDFGLAENESEKKIKFTIHHYRSIVVDMRTFRLDSNSVVNDFNINGKRFLRITQKTTNDFENIFIERSPFKASIPFLGREMERTGAFEWEISFRKKDGLLRFRNLRKNELKSLKEFEEFYNESVSKVISSVYGDAVNLLSRFLPSTTVLSQSTGESEFVKDLRRAIVYLDQANIEQVRRFLRKTSDDIKDGKLVIIEK